MKLKRYFSIFIMLVLFSALLPTAAFAANYSVTGSQELYEILPTGVLNGGDTLTIPAGATLMINDEHTLSVESGGRVVNNGTVTNNGTITNNGEVVNSGTTTSNGDITNNGDMDGNTGTVTNNFGTMENNAGTVTNNFSVVNSISGTATVTNNFGGTGNSVFVNEYYQVTVIDGDDTTNTLTPAGSRLWLQHGGSATFSPKTGYVIDSAQSNNRQAQITRNSDGTWTLTADRSNTAATEVTLIVKASLTGLTLSTNAPTVGTPVTATVAPAGATVTYQWYSNNSANTSIGTEIFRAESASYTPTGSDVGRYLYCKATGTNRYSGTVLSTATGAVTPASSVPHTGSDRQTCLMVTLVLLSGAVLACGVVKRKKSA